MKKAGVAILGLGVVGGGVYRILTEQREYFRSSQHVDLSVESVLELCGGRLDELGVAEELRASNIAEVVANPDVNLIVDCIGGVDAAKEYALTALKTGKTVVTSNRELYAKFAPELERSAKRHNAGFFFGGSCMGGIPVVRTLLDGVQSNRVSSMIGILDGQANELLTNMAAHKAGAGQVMKEDGAPDHAYDAAYQLSILASLAFHTSVPYDKILSEGIGGVTEADLSDGEALGYTLKLVAIAKNTESGVEARVHPAFVHKNHPLAAVEGDRNAIFLTGDSVGDLMLVGKGEGELPTGSAVVSDLLYAATHTELHYAALREQEKETAFVTDFRSAYYLRLTIDDEPGVLAKLSAIFAKFGVSIVDLIQRPAGANRKATLSLVTHITHESTMRAAIAKLNATGLVKVESLLRVA